MQPLACASIAVHLHAMNYTSEVNSAARCFATQLTAAPILVLCLQPRALPTTTALLTPLVLLQGTAHMHGSMHHICQYTAAG
jgi:hypothetical protein